MTIVAPVRELEIVEVRTLEQWRQDLLAAADWLEANEWCQGTNVNEAGARCALGALSVAASQDVLPAVERLDNFIGRDSLGSISGYNDEPGRTKAEVIATMRACAMQP